MGVAGADAGKYSIFCEAIDRGFDALAAAS
jgi:hypothetical protein